MQPTSNVDISPSWEWRHCREGLEARSDAVELSNIPWKLRFVTLEVPHATSRIQSSLGPDEVAPLGEFLQYRLAGLSPVQGLQLFPSLDLGLGDECQRVFGENGSIGVECFRWRFAVTVINDTSSIAVSEVASEVCFMVKFSVWRRAPCKGAR